MQNCTLKSPDGLCLLYVACSLESSQQPPVRYTMPSLSASVSKKLSMHVDDATVPELKSIESSLSSSDWRLRLAGVEQLQDLVVRQPTAIAPHVPQVCSDVAY